MRITLALAVAVATALLAPATGLSAPPSNDGFDFASAVSLPSTQSVDVTEATLEGGEPGAWCWPLGGSAWYKLQPSEDAVVRIGTGASPYFDRTVNVYRQTGPGLAGLSFIGCGYSWSQTTVRLTGGETYYVQAGHVSWQSGGVLSLTFEVVPPPANDDFTNAWGVGALPYSDAQSSLAATREPDEPMAQCGPSTTNSHWYAFTAPSGGSYTARTSSGTWPVIGLYRGSSVDSLTEIGCRSGNGGAITFHADAGETTYVQISDVYSGNYGPITFNLDAAPAPVAQFWYWPNDPSNFDTISFSGSSYDPGGNPIVEQLFEFGDGASVSGCCSQHRYSADGDYTARLTVTTSDGRVGTIEQVIRVRTHDVAIAKMQVPQSANVGQTRQVVVGLSNKRYGETVQVQLFKSGPGGYELVGTLTQSVPIRGGGRTTDFKFSYTFTSADAVLGKVTFKAVAQVVNARDAVLADNEAISLPTKVNG
jgi:PKD domain